MFKYIFRWWREDGQKWQIRRIKREKSQVSQGETQSGIMRFAEEAIKETGRDVLQEIQ